MGKVPAPNYIWSPSPNYSAGRQGTPVRKRTFHHVVGSASSAVTKFANSASQTSAHFIVGADRIYCCVDTDNTAWTNGNRVSNLESVTVEHEGDWRNGFRDERVINNSVKLHAWLLDADLYPTSTCNRHRDVAQTACPCDLPVEEIDQKAHALKESYYAPAAPITPEWLANRKTFSPKHMFTQIDGVRMWRLDSTSTPADTRTWPQNADISIAAETTVAGVKYYISEYSTNSNIAAGFKASELADTPYTPPKPSPEVPEWIAHLEDIPNVKMWANKQTFLYDLNTGKPVDGSTVYAAFSTVDDVSAKTVVAGKAYYLTEYSFARRIGRGFLASDLSLTDPTPVIPKEPTVPLSAIEALFAAISKLFSEFIAKWKT